MGPAVWLCWLTHCSRWISNTTPSPRSPFGKQPLMTQASSLFQPPTTTMSLFFLSYFIFIFLNSWSVGRAPHCSLSPAYWKRRVILPPERSWNLLQPKPDGRVHGAVRHSCSPPYDVRKSGSRLSEGPPPPPPPPSPSSLPRLGLCFWVAPLPWHAKSPKKNRFFIFSQSNSCLVKSVLEMQIWRREHGVCEERSLKKFGWSRAGPCSWCKFIHCEIQQDSSHEDVWLDEGLHPHKRTEGTETRLPRL